MKKQINVVGAVIELEGLILCAQRGPGEALPGMWEFPGGKIEAGETPRDALAREIREELKCEVTVGELLSGTPVPTEHAEVRWLAPAELASLDWAPADIPAVEMIETAGSA